MRRPTTPICDVVVGAASSAGPSPPASSPCAAGRTIESLPADIAAAVESAKISPKLLERFLALDASVFLKPFLAIQGFRERLMADPTFFAKVPGSASALRPLHGSPWRR